MGEVWLGRDRHLRRPVAVKIVQECLAGKQNVLRRFVEEAQLTSQLQHPGIPPVFERSALPDGRPYFCMKVVRGRTLQELLENRAGLSDDVPRFLAIFEQVCQAVAYAHSKRVIHRDLKPQNVMVGAFGEVQVMDWGLAKVLREDLPAAEAAAPAVSVVETDRTEQPDTLTVPGTVMGTYAYMPPEQARGEVALDRRCDVFGLGAILCEILTGSPPYMGTGEQIKVQAQNGDTRDAIKRLDASTADQELIALARSCLSPQISDRPVNADAVATAVTAYLAAMQERLRAAEVARAAAAAREEEAKARARAERGAKQLTWLVGALILVILIGLFWWQEHKRDLRLDSDRQAELAIELAKKGLEEGWDKQDMAALDQAMVEAKKAVELARDPDVREAAESLTSAVSRKIGKAARNQKLLTALLDAANSTESKDHYYYQLNLDKLTARDPLGELWSAFFIWAWMNVVTDPIEEVVAKLAELPDQVRQVVLAALDHWAFERRRARLPEVEWRRLSDIANQLDSDPRHRDLRRVLMSGVLAQERDASLALRTFAPGLAVLELWLGPNTRQLRELAEHIDDYADKEPILRIVTLSRALEDAGDTGSAERVLRVAMARHPGEVLLLNTLAKFLERQQPPRLPEAVECYRAARALRPGLGIALAAALSKLNRESEAEAILRDLARQQPNDHEMWMYLGFVMSDQNKPAKAEEAFRQAVKIKPNDTMAHYRLGLALHDQDKLSEAEKAFRKVIEIKPDDAWAYTELGLALLDQRKLKEAEDAHRRAIKIEPVRSFAYRCLGITLHAENKLEEAVIEFRNAIKINPDYFYTYYMLGYALHSVEKYDEAADAYRHSIRINPNYADAHYWLAYTLCHLQKLDEAVDAYRTAQALHPEDPDFRNRLHRAERLLQLNGIFPALLSGSVKPQNEQERIAFAELCYYKQHYLTATRNYAAAFAAESKLAHDATIGQHYNAACAAALAAARRGEDAKTIGIEECARLRQHALEWLRADLTGCAKLVEKSDKKSLRSVEDKLEHWQRDRDLTAVRDKDSLSAMPEPERERWQKLWADVNALLEQATKKRLHTVRWFDWPVSSTNALASRSIQTSSPI
jgi:tetratricopeptide (TPR) repeat protein